MDITITATNPRPTATGTEGGVDVDFRLDIDGEFELAGEVTLLQNERGNYSSWGELAHWLDGESLRVLREERFDDAFSRITSEIAAECGDAAGRAYPDGVEADDADDCRGERR